MVFKEINCSQSSNSDPIDNPSEDFFIHEDIANIEEMISKSHKQREMCFRDKVLEYGKVDNLLNAGFEKEQFIVFESDTNGLLSTIATEISKLCSVKKDCGKFLESKGMQWVIFKYFVKTKFQIFSWLLILLRLYSLSLLHLPFSLYSQFFQTKMYMKQEIIGS
eukprot:TCONS_00023876-protein